MIALTYTAPGSAPVTIDLGERLLWTDEYDWSAAETETAYSTTGALLVDCATRQAGRPISLDGQTGQAWITRAMCDQLRTWKALPGAVFALTVRGSARNVLWLEFSARPVWALIDSEHTPELAYLPMFKFLEV